MGFVDKIKTIQREFFKSKGSISESALERPTNRRDAKREEKVEDSIEERFEWIFERVKIAIKELCASAGLTYKSIDLETSLIEDLGLTSLDLVDLTIALEKVLSIGEFPIRDWMDEEVLRDGKRYTVRSLVNKCIDCINV
jgi:acyl carrier protein